MKIEREKIYVIKASERELKILNEALSYFLSGRPVPQDDELDVHHAIIEALKDA